MPGRCEPEPCSRSRGTIMANSPSDCTDRSESLEGTRRWPFAAEDGPAVGVPGPESDGSGRSACSCSGVVLLMRKAITACSASIQLPTSASFSACNAGGDCV